MKPIHIYVLTRVSDPVSLKRLERQMSGRSHFLSVKEWEIQGLRKLTDHLMAEMEQGMDLSFYYSFVLPKLGKEFDLLRISEDCVVNIELKSGNVSDEAIRRQLIRNRYYLAALDRELYSFTYISEEDRLVKLSRNGNLKEASWEELIEVLAKQQSIVCGDIENLFSEEQYLISPMTEPGLFLERKYFLTSQQYDIKKRILMSIRQQGKQFFGVVGLAGTGKSILLYDMAMELSRKQRVCILHRGSWNEKQAILQERLKRIDFCCPDENALPVLKEKYGAILVDEAHLLSEEQLLLLISCGKEQAIPMIFSYDREDALAPEERRANALNKIEELEDFAEYRLTNRIRVNAELSSFVQKLMQAQHLNHRRYYPSVRVAYANDPAEAELLMELYRRSGFVEAGADAGSAEEDRIVMRIDSTFYYDRYRFLRSWRESAVRNLYHKLGRAKKGIALVVQENRDVFEQITYILQETSYEKSSLD